MKLLVVDDQENVCTIVAKIAEQMGWDCQWTTQPIEIPDRVYSESINVLIMDFLMPGINGLEVAKQLRSRGLVLPIILFSGMSEDIDRDLAADLNIIGILEKPLDIQALKSTLQAAAQSISTP